MTLKHFKTMKTSNHINPTCNAQQQPVRRRNGNVARLPQNLRETVNSMLDDGIPYDTIIAKLREHGFKICRSNLTRWRNGGFQDFLKERLWLKEMQSNLDFILDHLRDNDGSEIPEAAIQLSSIRVFQFLRDFTDAAGTGISGNSTDFLRAANAACRLSQATNHLKTLKSVTRQSNQVSAP
jgi:hypothetical protein